MSKAELIGNLQKDAFRHDDSDKVTEKFVHSRRRYVKGNKNRVWKRFLLSPRDVLLLQSLFEEMKPNFEAQQYQSVF